MSEYLPEGRLSADPSNLHKMSSPKRLHEAAQTGEVLEGHLPPKALAMVREWAAIHKNDLLHMWETQEFKSLSPLE